LLLGAILLFPVLPPLQPINKLAASKIAIFEKEDLVNLITSIKCNLGRY